MQASTGCFSTADLLLDSLTADRNARKIDSDARSFLTINLNHLVTRIETNDRRATSVVCEDLLGGKSRRYIGDHIVLAAGSLESPRIAMASELQDPYNKIGIGLTDHPSFSHEGVVELKPESRFADPDGHAKVLMRHREFEKHPYSIELLVNPRYWHVGHSDDDAVNEITRNSDKTYAALKFVAESPLDEGNYVRYEGPGKKLKVMVRSNDSALHYREEIIAMRNTIFEWLKADFSQDSEIQYYHAGTVHHAGGSLRMSEDGSGVVDENLKFEAYDNLYCADVSVFPHIPTANPSLTLVALSMRLSDHLRKQLS